MVGAAVATCASTFVLNGVDRAGTLRWSHRYDDDACVFALGIGPTGALYLGGRFGHSLTLGTSAATMVHTAGASGTSSDLFIARLSPAMGRATP